MMNSNFYLGRPTTSVDCIVAVNGRGSLMRTGAVYNTAVCAVCVGVGVWGGRVRALTTAKHSDRIEATHTYN